MRKHFLSKKVFLLGGRFGYFLFFFCSGRGKGGFEAPGGGGIHHLLKIPGGVGSRRGRGAGRVSAANWGLWGGGGANFFFFRGRNVQVFLCFVKVLEGKGF